MVILMHVTVYLLAFSLLSLAALERAHRSEHIVSRFALAVCGAAGGAAATFLSLEGTSPYALIVAFACVAVCAATDFSTGLIYNSVTGLSLIGIAAVSLDDPLRMLAGSAVGYGLAYALRAITCGRGLGFGDVKLFGVVGAALGAVATLGCFGAAFVLGAIVSLLLLRLARIDARSPIPFAPYIATATIVVGCLREVVA